MRRWTRAVVDSHCGKCAGRIPAGHPALLIDLPQLSRPLVRCDACEGPAPPDLPSVMTLSQSGTRGTMTPLMDAKPKTRGAFKTLAKDQADRWSPYRDD